MNQTSGLFKLNWLDLGKGTIMAGIAAVLTGLYMIFSPTDPSIPIHFPTHAEWIVMLQNGIGAMVVYLIKNLCTPATVVVKADSVDGQKLIAKKDAE